MTTGYAPKSQNNSVVWLTLQLDMTIDPVWEVQPKPVKWSSQIRSFLCPIHILLSKQGPFYYFKVCSFSLGLAGRYRSAGSDVTWESRGTAVYHRVRHIFSRRFGIKNISTAILPFPLIQEVHSSVNGRMMCAEYW